MAIRWTHWAHWVKRLVCCGLVFACASAEAGGGRGGEWAQWGRDGSRNMASDEVGLATSFEPGTTTRMGLTVDMATTKGVRWVVRLGSLTYGNPVVAGGKVIVGTNDAKLDDPRFKPTRGGLIICVDAATGKRVWQLPVPRLLLAHTLFARAPYGGARGPQFGGGGASVQPGRSKRSSKGRHLSTDKLNLGICSSATVAGKRAYVVTGRGEVLCLDVNGQSDGNDGPFRDEGQYMVGPGRKAVKVAPGDGDIIWRYDMVGDLPVWPHDANSSAVLLHEGVVYVGTSNGVDDRHKNVPTPDAPTLIALDAKTGQLLAGDDVGIGRSPDTGGKRLFHGQWSSPTLGRVDGRDLIIYGGGDGVCYAFEPVDRKAVASAAATGKAAGTNNAAGVAKLKTVWSCDCNPRDYRMQGGKPVPYGRGHGGPSEIIATPVFHGGRVYVAIGQDPANGAEGPGMLTCIDASGRGDITRTGIVWSSRLVARTLSTVSIANGLLYIADNSGRLHCFEARTGVRLWVHDTRARPWGSTLVADGKVYLGTDRRSLLVLAAGRKEQLLAKTRLRNKMHNTPVAADGMLYIATDRWLYAVGKPPR